MSGGIKSKIGGIIRVFLLSFGALLLLAVIAPIVLLLFDHREVETDSNKRSLTERMTEYYGEPFALVSTERTGGAEGYLLSILQDSQGRTCSVSQIEEYDDGRTLLRAYDDYRGVQLTSAPAIQALTTQKRFPVTYFSETNMGMRGNNTPVCGWRMDVKKYDDLADVLTLVFDTLNDDACQLADNSFWRSEYWVSLSPVIRIGTQHFAEYAFPVSGQPAAYDYEESLAELQQSFCDWCIRTKQPELLPESARAAHPETGTYTFDLGYESLDIHLSWDENKECVYFDGESVEGLPDYPPCNKIIGLLCVCGYDFETYDDGSAHGWHTRSHGRDVIICMEQTTKECYVFDDQYEYSCSSEGFVISEKELERFFGVRLEAYPETMTAQLTYTGE